MWLLIDMDSSIHLRKGRMLNLRKFKTINFFKLPYLTGLNLEINKRSVRK